jgi:large subunit ribosomal protein L17
MRHQKAGRKLKRTRSHRRATLSALSVALITHKKITTTLAKAKETRMVVEKLVTRARRAAALEKDGKPGGIHARREVFAFLRDRAAVSTLFGDIAAKVGSRPGGYTRVVKLGQRRGDGAQMALIEFVDYNTGQAKAAPKAAKKTARATRKKRGPAAAPEPAPSKEKSTTSTAKTDQSTE